MATLGLDTATGTCAVAVRHPDGRVAELALDGPRHAQSALRAVHGVLDLAGLAPRDLTRIVVGVGPGSFTGLRVGIASALGLGRAVGAPVVGRSSLDALAAGAAPLRADVTAMIDARRGELFVRRPDGARECARPGELRGPGVAIGDGAVRYRDLLVDAGWAVPEGPVHVVRAVALVVLDEADPDASGPPAPEYLRAPDAVPRPSPAAAP
jgi:tRNA threonylcarbamoyladenosine biosynthesis protein TsaB